MCHCYMVNETHSLFIFLKGKKKINEVLPTALCWSNSTGNCSQHLRFMYKNLILWFSSEFQLSTSINSLYLCNFMPMIFFILFEFMIFFILFMSLCYHEIDFCLQSKLYTIHLVLEVAKWGGPTRSPLKKRGAGCLFQLAGPLRPVPQLAQTKCGAGRVDPHNPHKFKMYNFFHTPIFSSCSLIFYIPKFLITSYYASFMEIIL